MRGPTSAAVFPAAVVVLFFVSFIGAYVLSVAENHVYPFWPYISDCVMLYPDSNIFCQVVDIGAALVIWCNFLRLKQILRMVRELDQSGASVSIHVRRSVTFLGYFAFLSSVVSMFGFGIVGNFPESRGVVHLVGASVTFAGAGCFIIADAIVSLVLSHRLRKTAIARTMNKTIIVIRMVVAPISGIFSAACAVALAQSQIYWLAAFPGQTLNDLLISQLHWNKALPGYPIRLVSTVGEWITVMLYLIYVCTFIVEFRSFSVRVSLQFGPKQRYHRLKSNSNISQC